MEKQNERTFIYNLPEPMLYVSPANPGACARITAVVVEKHTKREWWTVTLRDKNNRTRARTDVGKRERAFVVAHEYMHTMYKNAGKLKEGLVHTSGDYLINEQLKAKTKNKKLEKANV